MYILGISCYYHDSAAALIEDGVLIAASQEERFSRKKNDPDFPHKAIDFCLNKAGITSADLEYVVFYEKPLVKFERILLTTLGTFPRSWKTFSESMVSWFDEKLWIKSQIVRELGIPVERVLFTDHHMSHAASAFYCSPYEEAAIMTIDGVGEWTTATMGKGKSSWQNGNINEIKLTHEQRFPHSLGLLYSAFTAYLGFRVNSGEYKVMGMAPYGEPLYVDKIYDHIIRIQNDGSFWLNMDYFSFHHSTERTFNDKFVKLFGEPRQPESYFITTQTDPDLADPNDPHVQKNQYYAHVAASIQKVAEETILGMANFLHRETGLKRLCMAGGVALNSVANGRILMETPFEEIFIQPAAGDAGGALGAALYVYYEMLHQPRNFVMEHAFWGEEYSDEEILSTLKEVGARFEHVPDDEALLDRVVDSLVDGKVIGLHQGRFEWGPRALGNRSILADPRSAEMKDVVNNKIKFREPYRPFAPVILEEKADEYFDGVHNLDKNYAARYMVLVLPWKGNQGDKIPAVNHLGTGRLQTVRKEWNPRYYRIIEKFGEATDVPVIMNTSFNLRGEPIVATPANAWNTFSNSGIDALLIGQYWVEK